MFTRCLVSLVLLGSSILLMPRTFGDERADFFEKRIRPLLVEHCLDCHGPDNAEGNLRLDLKSGWEVGGNSGPAIVPGDPTASLLIHAVSFADPKLQMPPPEIGPGLNRQQIDDLKNWIRNGAVDPRDGVISRPHDDRSAGHWAFQPIAAPIVPSDENPIDVLIRRKMRAQNFIPTSAADIRTLVRRAAFDLTGLPPTAEQLKISREEFPRLIRELLESPRYGETWARHWLDVARYSDAKDGVLMYGDARIRPFAYTYRDYVIRAFNDDKPFDEFVREQLAADQLSLGDDAPELAAMGLLTLGRLFDRNRHDVIDDQIDVVSRGFLGLTISCARCHDHKFDPIPTADYYSLYGVFASCQEPLDRPRIEPVSEAGRTFEAEFAGKLNEVLAQREVHYQKTLNEARDRTADYLVEAATTEPDIAETTIFFLSLIPDQLRPQITWRWRKLLEKRTYAEDPVFGPWHDMMRDPVLRPEEWRRRGIDERIIQGLVESNPQTPADIARTYGAVMTADWQRQRGLQQELEDLQAETAALVSRSLSVADIVAGGNGLGTGRRGNGIHPATGAVTSGDTNFIEIKQHNTVIPVPSNPFIDAIFVPQSESVAISTTGLAVSGLTASSGQTWDYLKFGPISKAASDVVDGINYSAPDQTMVAIHANKGVTFDLEAMRHHFRFDSARFRTVFGNTGAKDQSLLDFFIFIDGRRAETHKNFPAQGPGLLIDLPLTESDRFLTLIVTEGAKGISHDQAILGNPQIIPDQAPKLDDYRRKRLTELHQRKEFVEAELNRLDLAADSLSSLLVSRSGPVWFPIADVGRYLHRQEADAFRGLVGQLDAIAVRHKEAAARAMVLVDSDELCDPVIFHRGDPGSRGSPVPRQFPAVASPENRVPFSHGSGRLELANAIASTSNPLTARVWVNRVWMHHFGKSLVEDPGDFGLRTPRPVHAELLDFLADFLMKNGWRTKPLHELIMNSETWQRSSVISTERFAEQRERDPQNDFCWHANRRRLNFEQMRDAVLSVSGQLDESMYGRPSSVDDVRNNRRTVYTFVERQNIPSVVQTFDVASADSSTSRRVETTVPQQALFAMNSEFMITAAKALSMRVPDTDRSQVACLLYDSVLGREPNAGELELAVDFLNGGSPEQFAQVLLMSNEFMFVD